MIAQISNRPTFYLPLAAHPFSYLKRVGYSILVENRLSRGGG